MKTVTKNPDVEQLQDRIARSERLLTTMGGPDTAKPHWLRSVLENDLARKREQLAAALASMHPRFS